MLLEHYSKQPLFTIIFKNCLWDKEIKVLPCWPLKSLITYINDGMMKSAKKNNSSSKYYYKILIVWMICLIFFRSFLTHYVKDQPLFLNIKVELEGLWFQTYFVQQVIKNFLLLSRNSKQRITGLKNNIEIVSGMYATEKYLQP